MPTSPEPASEPTPTGPASTDPASSGSVADAFATFFQAMGRVETELTATRAEQAELISRFAELTERFTELTGSVIGLANRVNDIEQNAHPSTVDNSPPQYNPNPTNPAQYSPNPTNPAQYNPPGYSPNPTSPPQYNPPGYSPNPTSPPQYNSPQYSPNPTSPAPADTALPPDSMQRIAEMAFEIGANASQAATQAATQATGQTATQAGAQTATQAGTQTASTTQAETGNDSIEKDDSIEKIAGALADLVKLETNRVLLGNQSVAASASPPDADHPNTGNPDAGHSAAGHTDTEHSAAENPNVESPARSFAPPAKPGEEPEPLTLDSLDDPFLEALIKSEPLAN